MEDNDDVCDDLSSYAFTVDNFGYSDPDFAAKYPGCGFIFNQDSLPVGSIADSITVSITYSSPSSVEFYQYDDAGTLKNYVNFEDTQVVYFDDYAVTRLDLVSYDKSFAKSYFVKVNVHKTYGDTIKWQYRATDVIDVAGLTDQRVDTIGHTLYWFAEYNGSSVKVSTSDLEGDVSKWSAQSAISASELPVVYSIFNWNDKLYAAGKNGSLLSSTDGKTWTVVSTAAKFANILGVQLKSNKSKEYLQALVIDGGAYKFATSFDGKDWEIGDVIPSTFPIKGYSMPISVAAKPSSGNLTSRLYIVGGELQDGTYTASTWSCDGSSWAEFTQNYMPAMTNPAIIQYTLDIDAPKSFWILWPGVLADGTVKNTAYFSENKGVTWKLLSREFDAYATTDPINAVGGVSAFMNEKNYWMYFFGGVDADGKQQSSIFGGQLINLTFEKER